MKKNPRVQNFSSPAGKKKQEKNSSFERIMKKLNSLTTSCLVSPYPEDHVMCSIFLSLAMSYNQ